MNLSQRKLTGVDSVCIMEVICVVAYVGDGTEDNPGRMVNSYYDTDGKLLAHYDPALDMEE